MNSSDFALNRGSGFCHAFSAGRCLKSKPRPRDSHPAAAGLKSISPEMLRGKRFAPSQKIGQHALNFQHYPYGSSCLLTSAVNCRRFPNPLFTTLTV